MDENKNGTKGLAHVLTNETHDNIMNIPRFNTNRETRIIAVMLSKGGVGKTTTAANIAHGLSLEKRKVLLVDTDRQGQARMIFGYEPLLGTAEFTNPRKEMRHPFEDVVHIDDKRPYLHFMTGSEALDGWELTGEEMSKSDPLNPFLKFLYMTDAFKAIQDDYDYIIFDTPPGIGLIGYNVLFYATELLIPVFLSRMTEDSVSKFIGTYQRIQQLRSQMGISSLRLGYILPTFKDQTITARDSYQVLEKMVEQLRDAGAGDLALLHPIPQNAKLKELPSYGTTIFEHAPRLVAAQAYGLAVEQILKDETRVMRNRIRKIGETRI